ncbi:MAG: hypothetical protein ABI570_08095 [Ilumatobacteraceae bacterium]
MIRLDAATVLLQWSTGGLLFGWYTNRNRDIGPGYAKLLRLVYAALAIAAVICGVRYGIVPMREIAAGALVIAAIATYRKSTPNRDLVAPILGVVGLVAAGIVAAEDAGSSDVAVSLARVLVGAAFLGSVSDAMLLGHWYLVQPGMPRRLINELITLVIWIWPAEMVVLLLPTGMVSVLNGSIDDGWNGVLGWFWLASAVVTGVLVVVTRAALKERSYSAVMAATGLMYLAILTAFCTDIVGRALLA